MLPVGPAPFGVGSIKVERKLSFVDESQNHGLGTSKSRVRFFVVF